MVGPEERVVVRPLVVVTPAYAVYAVTRTLIPLAILPHRDVELSEFGFSASRLLSFTFSLQASHMQQHTSRNKHKNRPMLSGGRNCLGIEVSTVERSAPDDGLHVAACCTCHAHSAERAVRVIPQVRSAR